MKKVLLLLLLLLSLVKPVLADDFFSSTVQNAASCTNCSSLAANPNDCGAGTKAIAIDAQANLTCSAVSLTADVSGTLPVGNGGTGTGTAFTAGSVVFADGSGTYTQDNSTFFWDTTGKSLIVGNSLSGETRTPAQFTVSGNGGATRSSVDIRSYSATAAAPALLILARAEGTAGTPTAVLSADTLGRIAFRGDDGTAFQTNARIAATAAENFSSTNRGTFLQFDTTALTTTAVTERLRIGPAGVVSFGAGATSSIPALKPSGTSLLVRLGDDSADATLSALKFTSTQATGTAPMTVTSTTPVANLTTVPITYNHSGTQQTAAHLIQDSCTLGTDCAVTLAGSAVFTNSTSYTCVCDDATAANVCRVNQSSGSAFTITGVGTDVIRYVCTGN